jgi:predicted RecA/RadA family phage recombinase
MKNFIQEGNNITLTAPYNVTSGDGLLVGSVFGVASNDALLGAEVQAQLVGVFSIKKTNAQAWTQGALIYWDNTAKECTTTLTSNKLVGTAVAAAVNPSATGLVRLNGAFTS